MALNFQNWIKIFRAMLSICIGDFNAFYFSFLNIALKIIEAPNKNGFLSQVELNQSNRLKLE